MKIEVGSKDIKFKHIKEYVDILFNKYFIKKESKFRFKVIIMSLLLLFIMVIINAIVVIKLKLSNVSGYIYII